MQNYDQIWEEYRDNLLTFIRKRVNYDDADDILQDVFTKVILKKNTLKQNSKLKSWIFQITRNTIIDYYRTRKINETLPDWLAHNESQDESAYKELYSCLSPMIEQLPTKYKDALTAYEYEGKSQIEISNVENISLPAVKSRVQRARKKLKEIFYSCCSIELRNGSEVIICDKDRNNCETC